MLLSGGQSIGERKEGQVSVVVDSEVSKEGEKRVLKGLRARSGCEKHRGGRKGDARVLWRLKRTGFSVGPHSGVGVQCPIDFSII